MRARQFGWALAALLALGAGVDGSAAPMPRDCDGVQSQGGQRSDDRRQRRISKWWVDGPARAELAITEEQSARIEAIFQSTLPAQRDRWREHEKLEPVVEQLIKEGTADADHVARQVERLHTLKAELNATRITTLYRMQRELSPEQRRKFRQMEERRDAERRKSTESPMRR